MIELIWWWKWFFLFYTGVAVIAIIRSLANVAKGDHQREEKAIANAIFAVFATLMLVL